MNKPHKSNDSVQNSLIMSSGIAVLGVCLTALITLLSSMMIAESLEGDAAVIDLSGSMRMQSYRIANTRILTASPETLNHEIEKFERILNNASLEHAIKSSESELILNAAQLLKFSWINSTKPTFLNQDNDHAALLSLLDVHIANIDTLVKQLVLHSESKLKLLRAIQSASLFVVFFISFVLLYRVHVNMVQPLQDLVAAAQNIKQGDFSTTIHYDGSDELGLLAKTFNQMSTELDSLYRNLESRVEEKTNELQRSNDSLRILYESSRTLYSDPTNTTQHLQSILETLQTTAQLGTITLCLNKSKHSPAYLLLTSDNSERPFYCKFPDCHKCAANPEQSIATESDVDIIRFPIAVSDTQYGELNVEVSKKTTIEEWQRHLLDAITDIISTTLTLSQIGQNEARIALMEERSVIARELHDSLAQSLSYQKLQVSRLKKLHEINAPSEQIFDAIAEIQNGQNSAYKQLRELLATFRVKLDTPGLEPAIVGTIADFHVHSDIKFDLRYDISHCPLTPNEEIHCLQIIREALSNVIKHADANNAIICLQQDSNKDIIIEVLDDGTGINHSPEKHRHYGISIMTERARSLNGTLTLTQRLEGGTSVKLSFPPHFLANNHSIKVS